MTNNVNTELLRQQAYINGQWVDADNQATFKVTNPANGEVIAHVSNMGAAETERAIAAAQQALPAWRTMTAKQRSQILQRWFQLMMANQPALAELLSREQGKSQTEAMGEIAYGASFIEWFAEEGKRTYGETIPSPLPGRRIVTIKQPIGVVAAITPWNFPNAMITRKVGPALAAGCTVILKPASETPLSALALAALAEQAGIPAGVFNVVTGIDAKAIGGAMTQSPIVRKLSFTGSTRVGKLLMAQSADTVKKLSLELGGNAPFIVFDDADIDAAVQGALIAKFRNSGQTCVCANRILVQETIYDTFAERLAQAVNQLQVGPASDAKSQQGPLINQAAVDKVEEHISDAISHGARILAGGKPHALGGLFFEPTVLADVNKSMLISQEETFGPIAPLFKFRDEAEAIHLANETEFGLAAYFYSRDIGRIYRVAEALESGMVGINEGLISNEAAPFGGIKQSGLGREGSRYGIEDYLEVKYLCFGGIEDTGV
ncbi:succinate-semialdehyde dehydrogenase [Photorhabdus laumondii subsp. laumondii]|uniref:Succinate-semialdehyde dehydrogenase n=1 Tax=Photorhabdus laumondii subsp. laumondii TaxID=141679 RepID=A0A6L9JMJ0_PHOLM|nr:NAD-dependent succinate-semialdehyde dehydrogenase [Photorhabdus laumondii]MCC8382974.1 NAD-dependent succinate-semialdehyde dehydrogenase [Photorhabdus laumondii]MCC8411822.1 NAD-dependent succinate-semialdehyde dehydrogenase [Photorhabdus laumondii]NDK93390.1 succinate-semialdehyde dehydrogenase [Photorhabdus laumondii subsp. laumondii]NDL19815.1 succinate-semialdehyde dehydrogenase [Photorhabdus laumondii subsp. laumondii]NDL28708.1 succinate-semialdehyde dehydrogenase [Photorhabdus laum